MPRGDGAGSPSGDRIRKGGGGGPLAAGPGGQSTCPKCGYKVAHIIIQETLGGLNA